ncbi:unnamed protein product [Blepharisma stoltei]|uniref:ATP-dependent RNA helicase n=1 Tax=Blepharisma stoltei TaxID=1481888 RepID=A0AAU9JHQ5_9CILI|nr:unnamed protein product [Blepharisma stoltei]
MADSENYFILESNKNLAFISSYSDIPLKQPLMQVLEEEGIREPLPLHKQCLQSFLDEPQVMLFIPPATGKALLLCLGIFQLIDINLNQPQVIIVEPRKYLIDEMAIVLEKWGKYLSPTIVQTTGENDRNADLAKIQNSQIVIGTSGRLNNFLKFNQSLFRHVSLIVIDAGGGIHQPNSSKNAEERKDWVDQGNAVFGIINKLNKNVKKWWISNPTNEESFIKRVTKNPRNLLTISAKFQVAVAGGLIHYKLDCTDEVDKLQKLKHLLSRDPEKQKIIFCKKENLEKLQTEIGNSYGDILLFSNQMDKNQLKEMLESFRNRQYLIGICPSKGFLMRQLDTKDPIEIYNYDIAKSKKKYLRRIRRNGFFKQGDKVFNFPINEEEKDKLAKIERKYSYEMQNLSLD